MSATGSLYLLNRSDIPALLDAADRGQLEYEKVVRELAQIVTTYSWSGYVLAVLLPILKDNFSVDLLSSEPALTDHLSVATGLTNIVLTDSDRQEFNSRLEAGPLDSAQLQEAFEVFHGTPVPEAAEFITDGISFLRAGMQHVSKEQLLLLVIG